MDKSSIGKWIRVQSYKHDGSLHRTWDNVMIIDVTDDYIVTGSCASRVVECDGRIWYTKEPAVSIYFLKNWFNIIAMIRGQDVVYYCNIASPSLEDNNVVEYIDYDLDLKLFPDNTIVELDRKEYLFHKEKYSANSITIPPLHLIIHQHLQKVYSFVISSQKSAV